MSVVMPAFRAARTIGAAISGVLMQTCSDVELVVVDDGSDDETADIVAAYRDDRIRLVHQENRGVAAARNVGVTAAASELVAFCDADDVLLPSHIESMLERYEPRTIVTANAYWLLPGGISSTKLRHRGRFPEPARQRMAILERNFVSTMSLFPKALLDEVGPFEVSLRWAEDWDFWIRAVFSGHRVVHQPVPHALYRWSDDSLSAEVDRMDDAVRRVLERAADRRDLTADERDYLARRLAGPDARVIFRDAEQALRDGRYRRAAIDYRRAAALVPSESTLVWTARLLSLAPWIVGPALRARQRRREQALGFGSGHVR